MSHQTAACLSIALLACCFNPSATCTGAEIPEEFAPFRPFVGEWRGVGQVRRGSARGAWQEKAEWRYDFVEKSPRFVLDVEDGKYVNEVTLSKTDGKLTAILSGVDGESFPLDVIIDGTKTELSSPETSERGFRLTLTNLNEKRSILLIEERTTAGGVFRRLGEVGYTREGTRLAGDGASGPECIVTGGKGTIAVTHKGKTYYVCCTGCKQAFDADPEGILAAAAERAGKGDSSD